MLYLLLAIAQSTLIVVLFKLFTRYKIDNLQAIVTNYLVASALGFLLSTGFGGVKDIHAQQWLPYALLCGFFLMFVFNIFALSAQKVGMAITAVSSKMSVVIPVLFGFLLFKENLSLLKIAGIITAMLAFFLTFWKKEKVKIKGIYWFITFILFFGTGTNDFLLNYAERQFLNGDVMYFLATAFLISLFFGLIFISLKSIIIPQVIELKNIFAGVILGLLNFGSTLHFLMAMGYFESSVFFPVFNVSIVAIAALIGFFIFHEPLTKVNWMGILLATLAIVAMAIA
ncbi:MAG: DMT family transporter [Bacteroidales bacterium]|nr:DMT family transporter [Bacteroidales bacterium]